MSNHLYYTYGRQGLSTLRDCRLVVVTRLPPSSHLMEKLLSCAFTSGISRDRVTVMQSTEESQDQVGIRITIAKYYSVEHTSAMNSINSRRGELKLTF